jgi:hypothetical protein
MPEMKTRRPRAATMVAWEKCPLGWRSFGEMIWVFGMGFPGALQIRGQ